MIPITFYTVKYLSNQVWAQDINKTQDKDNLIKETVTPEESNYNSAGEKTYLCKRKNGSYIVVPESLTV